jgi:hypothetical protein
MGQSMQSVLPLSELKRPDAHCSQAVACVPAANVPAAQLEHSGAAELALNLPASQAVQMEDCATEVKPRSHGVHEIAPVSLAMVPGWQATHDT